MQTVSNRGEHGLDVMGQRIIFMAGQLLVTALALVPAAIVGGVLYLLVNWLAGFTAAAIISVIALSPCSQRKSGPACGCWAIGSRRSICRRSCGLRTALRSRHIAASDRQGARARAAPGRRAASSDSAPPPTTALHLTVAAPPAPAPTAALLEGGAGVSTHVVALTALLADARILLRTIANRGRHGEGARCSRRRAHGDR